MTSPQAVPADEVAATRVPPRIRASAEARIATAEPEIARSLSAIHAGHPLDAEPVSERKIARISAVARVDRGTAARIADNQDPAGLGLTGESLSRAEALQGKTVDYLGAAWLEAGRLASKAVGRIIFANGNPDGTGFLVSDRLLLTNHHVIPDPGAARGMIVEFAYELALGQRVPNPIRFALDPDTFFATDGQDDLDYTLIALGRPLTAGATLADFGACPLSDNAAKHSVGESVNIVEHPDGDYKQIVVRESRIVHRGDTVLHYMADTEPGASGSPVFNDQWQVVALHHWGGPHREVSANGRPLSRDVNEGIRISTIVARLKERAGRMTANQQSMLGQALNAPPPGEFGTRVVTLPAAAGPQGLRPWYPSEVPTRFAIGISEAGGGAPASRIDREYSNRRGYNERFLSGFVIPLPQLDARQRAAAARVRGVGESGNPFELKYQHFSVVLNAERRMPFYSICNVDGAKRIHVDRTSGRAVSGPEATETWAVDPRVPEESQLDDAFYGRLRKRQVTDFFARGHMTRREDPNWGTAPAAERANNDTYHHPNASPQVNNAFNASQKVWQGIENFVLNSADDANLRVTVITGPIFADDDPVFDDDEFGVVKLPRLFWKIVARIEDGERKVFAVIADQSEAMDAALRGRPEGREAFEWPTRLSREFKSTVAEVARLSGLDFGELENHDVFAGGESLGRREISGPADLVPAANPQGFGKFATITAFLEKWEEHQRQEATEEEEGAEKSRRKKPRTDRPQAPRARARRVVEIEAVVHRVLADDLSGARHQQFTVVPKQALSADARVKTDVAETIDAGREVRLAVRFGDSRGLSDRIPGIRSRVELHIKGEWIPAQEAGRIGGERIAVLHFTHDPLGFICTPVECFS